MTQPFGWNIDPYGLHEHRYFSGGLPTRLVRDGGQESYDEPPDYPPPAVDPGSPIGPPHSPVAVPTRVETGTVGVDETTYVDDQRSHRSPWLRRMVPLLGCAAALALIVALIVALVPGSGPPQRSACSLLTKAEANALLGYPATSQHIPVGKLEAGLSSCSFGPSATELRGMQRNPPSLIQSYRSLQLTIRTAPPGFPTTALRKIATPVSVGGSTAWWYSLLPGGGPASGSAHSLSAVKNGYEVSVQMTTTGQAEDIDRRAMADILQRI
jgi:hypothetical protein